MKSALHWFVSGILALVGLAMVFFGVLFFKGAYLSFCHSAGGETAFCSLLLGVILLVAGGGLFLSTITHSTRKKAYPY
jgi:apolipoprotein N-acyltransferase